MSGARLAALKLASLGESDRAWVLQKLTAGERQKIEPVISAVLRLPEQEIEDIVRRNHATFQPGTRSESESKKPVSNATDIQVIRNASINRLAGILDELDPVCLALLLDSQDWPWLTVYLNQKRPEVKNYLADVLKQTQGKCSANLLSLIVKKIAQRLQPDSPAPDSRSRFETLLVSDYSSPGQMLNPGLENRGRNGASA